MRQTMKLTRRTSRRFSALMVLILISFLAVAYANEDKSETNWPGWRGHGNDAVVTGTGLFEASDTYGLKVRWKADIGSGYSGISIADGIVVTMFADDGFDYLAAFDAVSGTERWRYRIDETHLGRYGSADGPISTPLIADGKVIGLGPRGQLFALDVNTGKPVWAHHLVDDEGVKAPMIYGFTTSPILFGNTVILETSNSDGSAVTGFDLVTGDILWKAGNDSVAFQSPVLIEINGKPQVLIPATSYLYGLEPTTGQVLWEYKHGEKPNFTGMNLNPVDLGDNRIFVKRLTGKVQTIKINEVEGSFSVEEVWQTQNLQRSYVVPVLYEDHLYGVNGRFFSCFNAQTGETVWKSRQPGDGFPIIVDGHLVVITKKGTLHLAKASPSGYQDMASINLFDKLAWTAPSYANGHIYARSFGQLACIEIVPEVTTLAAGETPPGLLPDTEFSEFVASLKAAEDKTDLVDAFMARQKQFPIIENDSTVHFIYRGEAEEMAISTEQIGNRIDHPMHRVADTDLYYYSTRLEPDARITYEFLLNTSEFISDTLNSEVMVYSPRNKASLVTMPRWKSPDHLKEATGETGRIDTVTIARPQKQDTLTMHVYLPPGYDKESSRRYPVAYMIDGRRVQGIGKMNNTLDNLIGKSMEPIIMVYCYPTIGGWYLEYVGDKRDDFFNMLQDELVPQIDKTYRTIATAGSRAAIGADDAGFMALYAATKAPDLFSRIGLHSVTWGDLEQSIIAAQMKGAKEQPLRFYHDWGKYDYRSPMEGTDLPKANAQLTGFLRSNGYSVVGGQFNDGGGWPNWRNRSKVLLQRLFPLK